MSIKRRLMRLPIMAAEQALERLIAERQARQPGLRREPILRALAEKPNTRPLVELCTQAAAYRRDLEAVLPQHLAHRLATTHWAHALVLDDTDLVALTINVAETGYPSDLRACSGLRKLLAEVRRRLQDRRATCYRERVPIREQIALAKRLEKPGAAA